MNIWWLLLPLILIHIVMAFAAAPPNAVARRFFKRFEVHQQVNKDTARVKFGDQRLAGVNSEQVISSFNKATFGYRYYKLPSCSGTPLVIHTKEGKQDVRIFIYSYESRVDVFKEYRKKVVMYRLVSENLQKLSQSMDPTLVSV
ncbi:YfmQ family protein [Pullulanibacillus sp. KACC 23026]|uniref:YfmQ family protein n=1 Tax=Pullulanibacillus sp. KACC 23026 TaxID=3028315 RepID=UPI0023AFBD44|nr:YfmQ family protein [Pullulanibacillus sp. KACC 23026]WEG12215.1 YfmQ family protein [Pullulanibacillus sp. KACC 23026]